MDSTKKRFLFVNKTVGSKHLGHSSGGQKRLIFSHAQRGMKALRTQHIHTSGAASDLCRCNSDLEHACFYVHHRKSTAICGICHRPIGDAGFGNAFDVRRSYGSNPEVIPSVPETFSCEVERAAGEAFYFFTTRTAVEWSGWSDAEFWQVHARQMSASFPSVQHALISLGAFHLSLEQADVIQVDDWRSMSLRYARRMLQTLVNHHSVVPAYVLILLLVVTTEVSALLHDTTWLQAAQVEFNLMSSLRKRRACLQNWNFIADHVEPTIEKRRSRYAQKIDMVWSLRIANPTQFNSRFELKAVPFESLDEAQTSLKHLLHQVTHEVKTSNLVCGTVPVEAENMVLRWHWALEAWEDVMDRSETAKCQSSLLKVSAKFGMLMIKTMYAIDELVFDQFESDYLLLLETYTKVVDLHRRTRRASATFATSSNLLCLISNTVLRWCRHPTIRQKLILLLFQDGRQEGHDVGFGWARLAERIQSIEEEGLTEPLTKAQDVPARNRIQLNRMTFYKDSYWTQLSYFRYPWREEDRETVWHSWIDTDDTIQLLDDTKSHCLKRQLIPIITLGRGYAECFDVMTGAKALDIRDAKFYFPILRL